MDERIELPEWIIEKLREEYIAEMQEIASDPDTAFVSFGWHGSDINATCVFGEKEVLAERISLADLCYEPAEGWHHNYKTDQYHYDVIGRIADELEVQARRIRSVHNKLKIKD